MDQEFFIAIFGAACIFILMPTIIGYFSLQEKKLKLQRELAQSGGAAVQKEVEDLRVRVAVLEKLVTDGDRTLASEIDRLGRIETPNRPI